MMKTQATMLQTHPKKISRWVIIFFFFGQICWFHALLRTLWWGIVILLFFALVGIFWILYDLGGNHYMIFLGIFELLSCLVLWIWTMLMIFGALHCMYLWALFDKFWLDWFLFYFIGMEIFCGYYFHGYGKKFFSLGWTYVWVIIEWIYGDEGFLGWLGYC